MSLGLVEHHAYPILFVEVGIPEDILVTSALESSREVRSKRVWIVDLLAERCWFFLGRGTLVNADHRVVEARQPGAWLKPCAC
jgi:hypothetical protein